MNPWNATRRFVDGLQLAAQVEKIGPTVDQSATLRFERVEFRPHVFNLNRIGQPFGLDA